MSSLQSFGWGVLALLAASIVGLAIAIHAYVAPLTGVNGSLGALVVIITSAVLAVLALVLGATKAHGARLALRVLILLGLVGTGVAGLLLHQWWLSAAMAIGLVALILDLFRPRSATRYANA